MSWCISDYCSLILLTLPASYLRLDQNSGETDWTGSNLIHCVAQHDNLQFWGAAPGSRHFCSSNICTFPPGELSFPMRKTWFPFDRYNLSVYFDWLHQAFLELVTQRSQSFPLPGSLWQKLLLNGRVASFSEGVPSGPTGRNNQTGQLQTDR